MSIVNRRAEDEAVRFLCLCNKVIYRIIRKDAAIFRTLTAAETVADGVAAELEDFVLDLLLFQLLSNFKQCAVGVSVCLSASIQH